MIRVLLVEDDLRLGDALAGALRRHGYQVSQAHTAAAALEAEPADVILLDLGLPDRDGIEVCRELRARFETADAAIIMVTARGPERERVIGLRSGADDYVVKPLGIEELCARIEAVLRRRQQSVSHVVSAGPVTVDFANRTVTCDDAEVTLTRKEFDLLASLVKDPGSVISREHLWLQVWHTAWPGTGRTLEVHVSTLRAKLGHPELIETVRGVGYRFTATPPSDG